MDKIMRADTHMHLLDRRILGHGIEYSLDMYKNYFDSENIRTAFVVYNSERCLDRLKALCEGVSIYGFYWIRNLDNYKIPESADAIKFESYIDRIDILDIRDILDNDDRNLPVYIHCGELDSHLSNSGMVEILAREYPDRKFIIGHCGAYAPPIDHALLSHLDIPSLVSDAIDVARRCDNVYIETSILNHGPKLRLIVDNIDSLIKKILIGTDFPLTVGELIGNVPADDDVRNLRPTIMSQEKILLDAGIPMATISQFYRNADDFFM